MRTPGRRKNLFEAQLNRSRDSVDEIEAREEYALKLMQRRLAIMARRLVLLQRLFDGQSSVSGLQQGLPHCGRHERVEAVQLARRPP